MNKKIGLIFSVFVITLILVTTSFAPKPAAVAATVGEDALTLTKTISKADQAAAVAFWTKDAIAAAEAFPMPVDEGPAVLDQFASEEMAGDFGSSASGAARANANAIAKKAYPSEWLNLSAGEAQAPEPDEFAGTSQVFTSFYGNMWAAAQTVYPHKWVGRLSFSTSSGTSYCSATAISNNHFVTAAHCVYDTGANVWYSNWAFTPAYRNGAAPYGTFPGTSCTILTAWKNLTGSFSINGWTKYDVAVCQAGNNTAGKTLNYMVGWAGRQWNYGYVRSYFNMGYPFKDTSNVYLPNAGKYLRICTAESRQQTTDTLGMGCNFGGGISGGPWLINYAPNVISGYVNSVNSGIYVGQKNLYGIRFTDQNIVPICNAQGC